MIFRHEHYVRWSASPSYPVLIGALAFLFTGTAVIPFETVFIPALAACPTRERQLVFASTVGSSLGAVVLAMAFRFVGWPLMHEIFPSLADSAGWVRAAQWFDSYGGVALVPLAALPISQAPALALAGLLQVSPLQVLAAFLVGKSTKYFLLGRITVRIERSLAG